MAYWLKRDLIAWPSDIEGCECFLHASKCADLNVVRNEIEGDFLVNLIQTRRHFNPSNADEKFHHSEKEKIVSGADMIIKLEKNSEGLPLEVATCTS